MNAIKPLARTQDTVTLRRVDFEALVRAAEDAIDLAAVEAHRAHEDRVGWDSARRNYLTADEARRLLDGESPVRVWREKRGIKQRTLADAAQVAVSYLAEIEGGKKPGSAGALERIADVLEMPLELLSSARAASPGLQPVSRAEAAAERLIALAEGEAGRDRLVQDAHTIVDEWRGIVTQNGLRHQIKAAIEVLITRVTAAFSEALAEANELERNGDEQAQAQRRNVSRTLAAARDQLYDERLRP
jgi:transcriptional regulator with XRE-family HTH domain